MKIAVVLLNWNGKLLLKEFLPTLVAHSQRADLYVIDNGSTDKSVEYITKNFPQIKIISLRHNYGFAKGYNEGLKHINADVFCLLNNDVQVSPNWLVGVENAFNERGLSIAQPLILDLNKPTHFEYAGAAGGFIDAFGFPYCRGRVFSSIEKNTGQYNRDLTCFWASGACFFVRQTCWEALGGFDEDFFMHQEEIDFCWRAFNHSHIVGVIPDSQVYHKGGATLSPSAQKTYYNHRNSLWMLIKNLPKNKLALILFLRMAFDGLAAVYYLLTGHPKSFLMVIKAHLAFYTSFSKMYRKRYTGSFKTDYFKHKSVVFEYFFLRKRKYSRL